VLLAAVLAVYAMVMAVVAPRLLRTGPAQVRHPRRALAAWISAFGSGIIAFVGAFAATISVGVDSSTGRSGMGAQEAWLTSALSIVAAWGALAAVGAVIALVQSKLEPILLGAAAEKGAVERLLESSTLTVWQAGRTDVFSVAASVPFAFSAPGKRGGIVITSGLAALLKTDELDAVIEHERAHITGRHFILSRVAQLNRACLPSLSAAKSFDSVTRLLIELIADDRSARVVGRDTLRRALSALSEATGEESLAFRARRLEN
jgi:Zn-dependent protease with chaperone function